MVVHLGNFHARIVHNCSSFKEENIFIACPQICPSAQNCHFCLGCAWEEGGLLPMLVIAVHFHHKPAK